MCCYWNISSEGRIYFLPNPWVKSLEHQWMRGWSNVEYLLECWWIPASPIFPAVGALLHLKVFVWTARIRLKEPAEQLLVVKRLMHVINTSNSNVTKWHFSHVSFTLGLFGNTSSRPVVPNLGSPKEHRGSPRLWPFRASGHVYMMLFNLELIILNLNK